MKAIGFAQAGASDVLQDVEHPAPEPGARDLLVAVRAVSVNPIDVKLRARSKAKEGDITLLGFDGAGIVEAIGSEVRNFRPGDAVFWLNPVSRQGTNAEYHLVDERMAGWMPSSLSFVEAAALPLTGLTAWELLFDKLRISRGSGETDGTLLIINGAGGVGSILIQLAARLTGLTVIATASRKETVEWARQMGAHHVIDHRAPLEDGIRALGFKQVDYVAGLAATDEHLPAIARVLAPNGHLALIDDPRTFDITPLRAKGISVSWEGVFVRALFRTDDRIVQHEVLNEISELVDKGLVRTTMREDFGPLTAASLARAHDRVENGQAIGKVVLSGIS